MQTIDSPESFARDAEAHAERLARSGEPEVISLHGGGQVVVMSVAAYDYLADQTDLAESLAGIARGLAEADRGEGRPASEFFDELDRKAAAS